jgi:hypothetical protein
MAAGKPGCPEQQNAGRFAAAVEHAAPSGRPFWEADEVAGRQRLLALGVLDRRCAGEHEQPQLSPVLIAVGAEVRPGIELEEGPVKPLCPRRVTQRRPPPTVARLERQIPRVEPRRPGYALWLAPHRGRRNGTTGALAVPVVDRAGADQAQRVEAGGLDARGHRDFVGVGVDRDERTRRPLAREDDEPAGTLECVCAAMACCEAYDVACVQHAAAGDVVQNGCAAQDIQPLLVRVVVVIRPNRCALSSPVQPRADSGRAEHWPQRGGPEPKPVASWPLLHLDGEHVDDPHSRLPSHAALLRANRTDTLPGPAAGLSHILGSGTLRRSIRSGGSW